MPHIEESILDDADLLARRDSQGTLRALATAGAQVREAIVLAEEAGVERVAWGERPRSVLVGALGGSAIVGDILDLLAEPGSPVPVTARRDLPLPGWVGPLDLVVAVSLSGRAPGPLALAAEAARRGCALLTVGAEDSPLADVCHRARGVHIGIGRGRQSSRTSLWTLLAPVLLAAGQLRLVDVDAEVMSAVADRLDDQAEQCRPASEAFLNPAKNGALVLAETVPMTLGDNALSGVAARRAGNMLARTARIPATSGELPHAASQVVACFDGPFTAGGGSGAPAAGIFADPFLDAPAQPKLGLLMLRDQPEASAAQEQAQGLADALLETAREAGVRVVEQRAEPGHSVVRLAELMAAGDYLSTYLALGLGVDPSVSPHIATLRDRTRGAR
ncbi:SIS domain-containing protein [Demetria terragena]|uniref:SIS domain-containing protein n=1 Tax=Demetria terragena TaxID=63959 RepID=UPI00036FF2AD|nr:SIS domain-containing protein [Demetria terragena]